MVSSGASSGATLSDACTAPFPPRPASLAAKTTSFWVCALTVTTTVVLAHSCAALTLDAATCKLDDLLIVLIVLETYLRCHLQ